MPRYTLPYLVLKAVEVGGKQWFLQTSFLPCF